MSCSATLSTSGDAVTRAVVTAAAAAAGVDHLFIAARRSTHAHARSRTAATLAETSRNNFSFHSFQYRHLFTRVLSVTGPGRLSGAGFQFMYTLHCPILLIDPLYSSFSTLPQIPFIFHSSSFIFRLPGLGMFTPFGPVGLHRFRGPLIL